MYEYVVVLTTGRTFGSDSLTCTTYAGVISHEVCLAIIISSMKSPVVFASLILCDVFENGYCLWSLARTSKKSRVKVAPIEQKMNSTEPSMRMRASSIFQAVKNVDEVHNDGTALFISATLLQRELIETTMPIQAGIILSILYISGAKGNAAVSGWTDDDYAVTMMYLGLDLILEGFVFLVSVLILNQIYPHFSALKIITGLFRKHKVEFALLTLGSWITVLLMQSTFSGLDMSLKLSWLDCVDGENRTWIGGFEWECS